MASIIITMALARNWAIFGGVTTVNGFFKHITKHANKHHIDQWAF
jgi:hypothetical protein